MLKIFKNLKYYFPQVCVLVVLVFAQVLCDLYLPTLMSSIINKGIIKQDIAYILNSGKIMVMVSGFGLVCAVIASLIGARISMDRNI